MRTFPKLISTAETASRLNVAQLTVRRWVDKGRLRGQRVGRSIVVEESSVAALEHLVPMAAKADMGTCARWSRDLLDEPRHGRLSQHLASQ